VQIGKKSFSVVEASSSPALNHRTPSAATAYTPLRMAATIPRSSRSLLNTYAAVPSLHLLVSSASNVCYCPRLACPKRVSDSACGSSTSSLRRRCYQDPSNSKGQSRILPVQSGLFRTFRRVRHGSADLPNGVRWSSTSVPPPPRARDGLNDAKRRTSSQHRPLERSTVPSIGQSESKMSRPTQRHWERPEKSSEDRSGPHGKLSDRSSSPQRPSSGSQTDPRRKASWSRSASRGTTSVQQSGPNRRPVSTAPRPMQSGGASLSVPERANDRGSAQSGKDETSLTDSGSMPPPPPYDILFCGTDFFALEIVRALYARRGK
jgi:hypothetical protein